MSKLTKITINAIAQIVILVALTNTAAADNAFNSTMTLIDTKLSVKEEKSLRFGEAVKGLKQTIITNAADDGAAVFSATGIAGAKVTASIVEDQILMTTADGSTPNKQIIVKRFKKGGSLNRKGRATFNDNGKLADMRIGARAKVKASNVAGDYAGNATFRIVYR